MKTKIKNSFLASFICFSMLALTCCEDDREWSEDYDIVWPITTIENVQPMSASPGDIITISGKNLQHTYNFYIGNFTCEIVSKTESQLTIVVPENVTEQSTISVFNLYRRTYVFEGGMVSPILE